MIGFIRRWWLRLRLEQQYSRAFEYWLGWRGAHRHFRNEHMTAGPIKPPEVKDDPRWVHLECACPCECPNEFNFYTDLAVPWPTRCWICRVADERLGVLPHPPVQGHGWPPSYPLMEDGIRPYRMPVIK